MNPNLERWITWRKQQGEKDSRVISERAGLGFSCSIYSVYNYNVNFVQLVLTNIFTALDEVRRRYFWSLNWNGKGLLWDSTSIHNTIIDSV